MEGIQVSVEKLGSQSDISIIRVGGYIDTTTSAELERALDSLLKAGVFRIIVDLGSVDYISSAGWGIFISEIKGMRERGGDLKLARMIPDVYEVFELLEFHYILKAFDTIEEAARSFDRDRGVVTLEEELEANGKMVKGGEEEELSPESSAQTVEELIEEIALEHPEWNASRISRELKADQYGNMKIGSFAVKKILKNKNAGKE